MKQESKIIAAVLVVFFLSVASMIPVEDGPAPAFVASAAILK